MTLGQSVLLLTLVQSIAAANSQSPTRLHQPLCTGGSTHALSRIARPSNFGIIKDAALGERCITALFAVTQLRVSRCPAGPLSA
jgi:hypothetical protein